MSCVLLVGPADRAGALPMLVLAAGHDLYAAPDAERALAVADAALPNVVLYDVAGAGLSPWRFARRLRATPGCEVTLLVALTPRGAGRLVRPAAAPGFDLCLNCPVDPWELSAVLGPSRARWRAETALPGEDDFAEEAVE
jgi:CheY-like chemotaxis protein